MAFRKDKFGWVKIKSGQTNYYTNSKYPNLLCYRLNVPGVLYPWGVRSGVWKTVVNTGFEFDDKYNAEGFACGGKLGATQHAQKYQPKYKEAT